MRSIQASVRQRAAGERDRGPDHPCRKQGHDHPAAEEQQRGDGAGEDAELPTFVEGAGERDGRAEDRPDRGGGGTVEKRAGPPVAAEPGGTPPPRGGGEGRRRGGGERGGGGAPGP